MGSQRTGSCEVGIVSCGSGMCHGHQNHVGTGRFLFNCVESFPIAVVCLGFKATRRIYRPPRTRSALSNQHSHVARHESHQFSVAPLRPEFRSDGASGQLPDLDNWVSGHLVTDS